MLQVIVWFIVIAVIISRVIEKQSFRRKWTNKDTVGRNIRWYAKRKREQPKTQSVQLEGEQLKTQSVVQQKEQSDLAKQMELKRRLQQRYGKKGGISGRESRQQDILSRAFANANEDFEQNTYLSEKEHKCNKTTEFLNDSEWMQKVQDLMIMGYQGHLQYERDFIGEAQDKINSFMKY